MIISMVTDENRANANMTPQAQRALLWNVNAGRNPSEPTDSDIANQWGLVVEESKAVISAFYHKDLSSLMRAICGAFAVSSYHSTLVANQIGIDLPDLIIHESYTQDSLEAVIGDLDRLLKADDSRDIAVLIDTVMSLVALVNGDIYSALNSILDSNDSKLIKNDITAAGKALAFQMTVKNADAFIEEVKQDDVTWYSIQRTSDNKVLCPDTFRKVSLKEYIPKAVAA